MLASNDDNKANEIDNNSVTKLINDAQIEEINLHDFNIPQLEREVHLDVISLERQGTVLTLNQAKRIKLLAILEEKARKLKDLNDENAIKEYESINEKFTVAIHKCETIIRNELQKKEIEQLISIKEKDLIELKKKHENENEDYFFFLNKFDNPKHLKRVTGTTKIILTNRNILSKNPNLPTRNILSKDYEMAKRNLIKSINDDLSTTNSIQSKEYDLPLKNNFSSNQIITVNSKTSFSQIEKKLRTQGIFGYTAKPKKKEFQILDTNKTKFSNKKNLSNPSGFIIKEVIESERYWKKND